MFCVGVHFVLLFTGRPTLPMCVLDEQPPDHLSSPSLTPSPPHTLPPPVSQLKPADWLLRDTAYSEVVAEHKQSRTCRNCECFHENELDELQVSINCSGTSLPVVLISSCNSVSVFWCSLHLWPRHRVSPALTTCRHVTSHGSASSLTLNSPPSCWLWASKPNAPAHCAARLGVRFIFTWRFEHRFETTHSRLQQTGQEVEG